MIFLLQSWQNAWAVNSSTWRLSCLIFERHVVIDTNWKWLIIESDVECPTTSKKAPCCYTEIVGAGKTWSGWNRSNCKCERSLFCEIVFQIIGLRIEIALIPSSKNVNDAVIAEWTIYWHIRLFDLRASKRKKVIEWSLHASIISRQKTRAIREETSTVEFSAWLEYENRPPAPTVSVTFR